MFVSPLPDTGPRRLAGAYGCATLPAPCWNSLSLRHVLLETHRASSRSSAESLSLLCDRHAQPLSRSALFTAPASDMHYFHHQRRTGFVGEAAPTPPHPRSLCWGVTAWSGSLEPPPTSPANGRVLLVPLPPHLRASLTSPSLARPCVRVRPPSWPGCRVCWPLLLSLP